ncbi:MAG: TetR family transcriptional regulator [Saccharothrix sp.]|nr:TetR family transcriptional regulator [Saccharothrix sp.]
MSERVPLRERKQQRAREQIVRAAFELFAERGFADVTVTDIAERAEVGRTTFFRYFGDKQEVAFADEQAIVESLTARHRALPPVHDLAGAVAQIRGVVLELCREFTADEDHFRAHLRLLRENAELRDRAARKFARLAEVFRATLLDRGTPPLVAALAPQLGVACYLAGQDLAGDDPAALPGAVDAAFARLSELAGPVPG